MSRYTNYRDDKLMVVSGFDHVMGNFIQLYDKDVETPEGEGIVLDWSEMFGLDINFTGMVITNNHKDVMLMVGKYISERVDNLVIITAEQNFSLN